VLWHKTSTKKHQEEIDECINKNLNLSVDRKIVLIEEKKPAYVVNAISTVIALTHRQNLNDVFDLARNEPPGTICAVCNADCYWDATLERVKRLDLHRKILAITRITGADMIEPMAHGCQDGWIWLAEDTPKDWEPLEFGRGGIDNRLVYLANRDGYKVENRCDLIRLQHLHADNKFNGAGRFPSYPHPHGYIDPGPDQPVFIAQKPGEFPPKQTGLRYPRLVNERVNGRLVVRVRDDVMRPAPLMEEKT